MDTSQTRLFSVPELLESILLNLPRLDMFVAQSVCKDFNNTIIGSAKLQRRMFEAEPPKVLDWLGSGYTRMEPEFINQAAHRDFILEHLELKPYSYDFYDDPDEDGNLTVNLKVPLGASSDGLIGWRGKNNVHAEGTWKRIKMGLTLPEYRIQIFIPENYSEHEEPWIQGSIPASGTYEDFIEFLQEVREPVIQEQKRLEQLDEVDSESDWSSGS